MRLSLFAALVAALALVAGSARAEDARTTVKQKINLSQAIEANTPLKEALEFLGGSYKIKITMDENAFTAAGVPKVGDQPVKHDAVKDTTLLKVLQNLAGQVQGTCLVDKDGVKLVPKKR